MTELPDLSQLTHEEKDALIRALWAQVQALTARVAELEAKLGGRRRRLTIRACRRHKARSRTGRRRASATALARAAWAAWVADGC